ncbi:MAG: HAMP domain-containing sensor histidine kinase [Kofleriaceae bacterium]
MTKLGMLSGTSRALPPEKPRRFRSLASRLVLVGVIQLVLLAVTAVVIFFAEGPHEPGRPDTLLTAAMIKQIESQTDDQPALVATLTQLLDDRVEASVYDSAKVLVASNVDPPLAMPGRPRRGPPRGPDGERHGPREPPPPDGERPYFGVMPPGADGPHRMMVPIQVHDARGFLVARGIHGEPPGLTGPILVLICGFAILVIGALITARWIVRPIERLSRTARALGAGDLGARSRLERSDEIGELGHRVDELADRMERLLATEKELLANVAHELRTPLTRIGVALDLAGEGDAEAARASLGEIALDVAELEQIVDDILTAMRFEVAGATQLPLRRAVVEPRTIAEATAERMCARHPERSLTVTVAKGLPPIDVDPKLFRRVLDNLVENAHKYTPDTSLPIELAVTHAGDRVVFAVRDRGIGILAEDLPRVFAAFFRGDRSRSRETGGVGLGLTLAKRLVEAHGGTIEVESAAGAGTTVRVAVPAVA